MYNMYNISAMMINDICCSLIILSDAKYKLQLAKNMFTQKTNSE